MANKFSIGREPARKQLDISTFLGVDYSSSEINVSNARAVDMCNVVYKDKVNQKRNGWQQTLKIEPFVYYTSNGEQKTNTTEINGVWSFLGEDNKTHIIAHIGSLLYELKNIEDFLFSSATPLVNREVVGGEIRNIATELLNYKSTAFIGDKRLYILGGNFYYVLRYTDSGFDLRKVEDDKDTYVPTTRIGVTYKDSLIAGSNVYDDVNLLTQWRKNKLVSGTYIDDGVNVRTTRFFDYELESAITPKTINDLNNIEIVVQSLEVK